MNIQDLTPQDKRKLEKLAKIIDEGDLAILEHLFEIEQNLEDTLSTVESKVKELEDTVKPNLNSILEQVKGKDGIVGPQGEQGIQGDKGEQGNDGKNGKDGKDGRDGRDGRDGTDGLNGDAGRDGIDGKDGSPDSPKQIADKVNTLYEEIEPKVIKGWSDLERRINLNANLPKDFDVRIGVSKTEIKRLTDRVVVLEAGGGGSGTWYQDEILTRTDGTTYTLAHTPTSVLFLYLNGQLIINITDYTRSGATITMVSPTLSSDILTATYS